MRIRVSTWHLFWRFSDCEDGESLQVSHDISGKFMGRGNGMNEAELREQIAQDIEKAGIEMKADARQIGSDAFLVTNRVVMACAAIARGLVK